MLRALNKFPRYALGTFPTPLEPAPRLSKELGIELLIKRDDVVELALGGNKVRKLEFLIGDALDKGCDTVITTGAMHSNHARLTAAAAIKAGMRAYLVLTPPGSEALKGNLLLDKLLGSEIVLAESDPAKEMEELAERLRVEGLKPYIIPAGGASPVGVLGYVQAAVELMDQVESSGKGIDYVVLADSTCAMHAGLLLGLRALGAKGVQVIGISVGKARAVARDMVRRLVDKASDLLGIANPVREGDIIVNDDYIFGGYGSITKEVVEAMKLAATKEAIILDPVYTGKAFAGLIGLARSGYFPKGSRVVFIHSGGSPILFQYDEVVASFL